MNTTMRELLDFRDNNNNLNLLVNQYFESRKKDDINIVPFVGAGLSAFCYCMLKI